MKSTQFAARAAVALGAVFAQSPAFAQDEFDFYDGRSIPGVACSRLSGGSYGTWYGTVMNQSESSQMTVMCPLVKRTTLTPGYDWYNYFTRVEVYDRHTADPVTCVRRSEYVSGSSLYFQEQSASTSGNSSNVKNLDFAPTENYNFYDYVQCTLPAKQSGLSHVIGIMYVSAGE